MSNEQDMVIICWQSMATGYESEGVYPVTRKVGQLWVKKLNKERPTLRHWLRPYTVKTVQEKTE